MVTLSNGVAIVGLQCTGQMDCVAGNERTPSIAGPREWNGCAGRSG